MVFILYREESLVLLSKRPLRRKMVTHRQEWLEPKQRNAVWSLDFVQDHLSNDHKLRALKIVDVMSREALAIGVF